MANSFVAGAKLRPDKTVASVREVRARVASALDRPAREITVKDVGRSPSCLTLRCTGFQGERRYFAKIFLTDQYPVARRFFTPWEEEVDSGWLPVRSTSEQIEAEWAMTQRVSAFAQGAAVPTPLGRSLGARTIVWEKAEGKRLDRIAAHSIWTDARGRIGALGAFQAGRWLRSLHAASALCVQFVNLAEGIQKFEGTLPKRKGADLQYCLAALRILKGLLSSLPSGGLELPVALNHGDFCPANVLWDEQTRQLAVVDYELACFQPVAYDLFSFISELRAQLLRPHISRALVQNWESAFWNGYGEVSPELRMAVDALAHSRIYYYSLARLLTRGRRRGWIRGAVATLYRLVLEPYVRAKRLEQAPWFRPGEFVHEAPRTASGATKSE